MPTGKLIIGSLAAILLLAGTAQAQDGEVVIKQYDDGSVYEGTFKDGRQDGTGTYSLPNGYIYEGEWTEGRIEGTGAATYPNGSVYSGTAALMRATGPAGR